MGYIIKETYKPHIKDSGTRREFETGAVRDIQEGKGRCDLLPLDVLAAFYEPYGYNDCNMDVVLGDISEYVSSGEAKHLFNALEATEIYNSCHESMFLEVSKHFEEGAKKYGEYNWQKGIPTHCYIDSAVRHYLKYLRGDTDEPHDRAFVWNILCCIWTCKHKPELNDYDPDRNKIVDAMCEVGNVNIITADELKAAMGLHQVKEEVTAKCESCKWLYLSPFDECCASCEDGNHYEEATDDGQH